MNEKYFCLLVRATFAFRMYFVEYKVIESFFFVITTIIWIENKNIYFL